MATSFPEFCSLTEVIDWAIEDSPSSQCVFYLPNKQRPCAMKIASERFDHAGLDVMQHLHMLAQLSRGIDASLWIELYEKLATKHLCHIHKNHHDLAVEQWQKEFTTKRASIVAKLKEYNNLNMDDTSTADDTGNVSTSQSDEEDPDNEKHDSGEDDDLLGSSTQSSQPLGVLRRNLTFEEDEVARDVTHMLEQPIKESFKMPGWIYAIRLNNLPGIIKVGYSLDSSIENRFRAHEKCHQEFEVLRKQLIPYAYRVEQLLLKEFSNKSYKLETGCQSCNKCHQELLAVDEATLLASLEKWITFVQTFPYNNNGNLKKEAKESLPHPASKSYLRCKRSRHRRSTSMTPGKKEGRQDIPIVPEPMSNSKLEVTIRLKVQQVERDHDGLCSAVNNLELTPSKNKRGARRS